MQKNILGNAKLDYIASDLIIMYRLNGKAQRVGSDNKISSIKKHKESYIKIIKGKPYIDTDSLEKILFPVFTNQIFISHFSKDENRASQIKYLLQSHTGFEAFIDSDVWDNIYELMTFLQDRYCKQESVVLRDGSGLCLYDVEQYNDITKNILLAFSITLQRVIANSCAFVFICKPEDILDGKLSDKISISSPWVAQEIYAASLFPHWGKLDESSRQGMSKSASIGFCHDVSIRHLQEVKLSKLIEAINVYGNKRMLH